MDDTESWRGLSNALFAGQPQPVIPVQTAEAPSEPAETDADPFQQWVTDAEAATEAKQRAQQAEHVRQVFEAARASAPVIAGQGSMPAPPAGMRPDTREMLDLISAPHLRSH